ncbi:hypothetical protein [Nocardia amikacinitolerans]|uniref:hypothetical protein n=1 Tax=Nocardia amikacinitolerans TaxID=756689 RepID=UPI0035569C15
MPFGDKTRTVRRRYLRVRARHRPQDENPILWLGYRGAMTGSGIRQMLERRCDAAGIERLHPHQLRHFFSHTWLDSGARHRTSPEAIPPDARTVRCRGRRQSCEVRASPCTPVGSRGDRFCASRRRRGQRLTCCSGEIWTRVSFEAAIDAQPDRRMNA